MKTAVFVLTFFLVTFGFSQSNMEPCAFDRLYNNETIYFAEQSIKNGVIEIETHRSSHDIKYIPVVVHVIHTGGSENISDLQIQSQIEVLNEDYGKLVGTNGDGNGVDTKVRFCLAKKDPNGNCTNGIVRVYSTLANHQTYERPLLKELSFWDNARYMNIYVVKSITGGTLGYSSFPGGPPDEDGIVVRHNYFGNVGTASSSLGRTTTHEAGHWFGLYHTFNGGCGTDVCNDGDFVCDTPPVASANFGCPNINSCSNEFPDVQDQVANYLDYTNDPCKSMFTAGQRDRIQATMNNIRTDIWTQSNLLSTGCDSLYVSPPSCPVIANFSSLSTEICLMSSVQFTDISLNNATSWQWYFPGGTPSTSTLQNPVISYPTIGNYDVALVASDGVYTDSINKIDFVNVTTPGIGLTLPYQENFDSNVFPPNGITIFNADGGITWELDSSAYVSSSHSVRINNLINTNYGSIDEIVIPFLDLSSLGNTPYMRFDWAYAKSDPLYSDEMIVQLSTDCGNTWSQVLYRTGTQLASGPTQTTPFIPDSSQWKSANINLGAYGSEQYVSLKIVNVTDGGNNLYIDNINIGDVNIGLEETIENPIIFNVYPNPTKDIIQLTYPQIGELRIYSSTGTLIKEYKELPQAISFEDLSPGIYYIKFYHDGGISSKKIIVLKH